MTRSGDELEDLRVVNLDRVDLSSLLQDRYTRRLVGGGEMCDEPGLETLTQPLLEVDELSRQPVAGQNQLAA